MAVLSKVAETRVSQILLANQRRITSTRRNLRRQKLLVELEARKIAEKNNMYERKQKRIRAKRLPIALQGVKNLVTLAESELIRKLIRSRVDLNVALDERVSESFLFYDGCRRSGDIWTDPEADIWGYRVVQISLTLREVLVHFGAMLEYGEIGTFLDENEFDFDEDEEFPFAKRESRGIAEITELRFPFGESDEFYQRALEELPFSDIEPKISRIALNHMQLKTEWWPPTVAAETLIDCANRQSLDFYLKKALNRLSSAGKK